MICKYTEQCNWEKKDNFPKIYTSKYQQMWETAAHVRISVCGTVWDSGDLTSGGHQEGDNGHPGDGEETNET